MWASGRLKVARGSLWTSTSKLSLLKPLFFSFFRLYCGGNMKNKVPPKKDFKNIFKPFGSFFSALLIFFLLVTSYSLINENFNQTDKSLPFSEVAALISKGEVSKIKINGDKLEIILLDESQKASKKESSATLSQSLAEYGITGEMLQKVSVEVVGDGRNLFLSLAPIFIPILFLVLFIWMLTRQVRGAGMQAFSFGQSKARMIDPNDKNQKVTFKDIAGAKEAKEELKEIVDFLKNPKKFLDIGAQIPKGVILMGAPGTGKTLLARAVAGEAGVPFFHLSGSEFVEMFVGVGASRVRDLFQLAKKSAPAIVFVDEIDAVGRIRGTGVGGGNDEREQTLNQILVEMDGFEPTEKVIVMAATNRPDVLDPALLRPGRFDRRVTLDLPDRNDREEVLKIHARKKPLGEDIDLRVIAERTPGFSGADLYSLMNEGAILAAREDRNKVTQYDLIRAIEKVLLGPERKSHLLTIKEKEVTAYHEAGHALVSSVLPLADPVHKVTIIARGHAGGYTLKLPLEEKRLQRRQEFLDDIAVSLGGYVAEEMVFGDITTGPSNDLQVATALARSMVTKYGMGALGPVSFGSSSRLFYGQSIEESHYSQAVMAEIDQEVSKIMHEAKKRAEEVLTTHRPTLDLIAKELVRVETLEREAFENLLRVGGIVPKREKFLSEEVAIKI